MKYLRSLISSATPDQAHLAVMIWSALILGGAVIALTVAVYLRREVTGALGVVVGGLTALSGAGLLAARGSGPE